MSEVMGTEDRRFLMDTFDHTVQEMGRLISWLKCRKTAKGW
ncbi:MAG: hypothetical protein VX107_09110 [Pseudomonadota bacterium]|nr:hypothetical protein [Pseudomonadota bacterium]